LPFGQNWPWHPLDERSLAMKQSLAVILLLSAVLAGCVPVAVPQTAPAPAAPAATSPALPAATPTTTAAPPAPAPTATSRFSANAIAVPPKVQPTAAAGAGAGSKPQPTPWPTVPAPDYWPTDGWRTAAPEDHGVDGALLKAMEQQVVDQKIPVDSILIVKDGYLIHESYFGAAGDKTRHELYSATKGFVSTLFGIAHDRSLIGDLRTPVLDALGRKDFKNMDDRKAAITLEDILTQRTGLKWDESRVQDYNSMKRTYDWVQFTLDRPMVDQPGQTFVYCSGGSHLLSVLIQKYTGMTMAKFAEEALFKPLGITKYDWSSDPTGITEGATGLRLTSRDFAKLGLLYLQEGRWDGQQVVSQDWVRAATATHTPAMLGFSYGYQWWTNDDLHMYAALGGQAQNLWVWPEKNLLVVTTARIGDNQVWDPINNFIVPAAK
jgi:CubicO group peptidase (beta-lactamase class C family)